ncbi:MAG: hypothetical protein HHAS10_07040 [Candidatus Altimarinota bacterium]
MNAKAKAIYRIQLNDFFESLRIHPIYDKIMILPSTLRIFLSFLFFLMGIIGFLSPIPIGLVFMSMAGILIFGIKETKRYSIRLFFTFRIHKLLHFFRYSLRR